uniref:Putative secreted peptide n=1 Tax=Anopheles braziliensis TaxID=58242 RepID=A0A2M3ZW29_9DIPT
MRVGIVKLVIVLQFSTFALRITFPMGPMYYIYDSKSPSLARYTSGTSALIAGSSEAANFSTSAALWIPVSTSSV